jgi:hypothetical protein
MARGLAAAAAVLAVFAPAAEGAAPAPLSRDRGLPDIRSSQGAGVFGRWTVDRAHLPAYDYTLDQTRDPRAQRRELGGRRDAWSQVGNDAIVANAHADGHVELWSQARMSQWVNRFDAAARHYAGGWGYLRDGARTTSTSWLDRPAGSDPSRRFGVGYFGRALEAPGVEVDETVTAPFGDAPALVHEVTLRNTGRAARRTTWWEYWDVNPYDETLDRYRGLDAPRYEANRRTLAVRHSGDGVDTDPLTVFLAAADAPVEGFESDLRTFFGDGGRARPAAVVADRATDSIAPAAPSGSSGSTTFALRSPVTVPAGRSVTLRYVYGIAHDDAIAGIVDRVRAQPSTWAATARAWRAWLPRIDLGSSRRALSREMQWAAYSVRSSSNYEEACGRHVVTQGGYYQYGLGEQIAFRDPLQHILPLVYADRELARETLRYSFQEQPPGTGALPYGMGPLCTRIDAGTSNDLDFWLLLSTAEYVLGSRDLAFLDERVPYRGGLASAPALDGTVWEHVKLAVRHQEDLVGRGPHGHYLIGATGDWSDFATQFLQITESVLVTAQLAYAYPRLAEVADLRGDSAFAADLRRRAAELLATLRGEWTGRGWYSRGYRGTQRVGEGVIFGEPQPWALLTGAPEGDRAARLVANVRRYLGGVGAPAALHGPARIGSSISPAKADPDVTERSFPLSDGVGDGNAVYVGGAWYAINGPLAWAVGELDGRVRGAAEVAFDEWRRNTLTAHADAYPASWDGVLNVDDACWSFYSSDPGRCGIGTIVSLGHTSGQVTHQPAWSLFSLLKLAGVEPSRDGYRVAPHLPVGRWSIRLPDVGVAQGRRVLRGYVRPAATGSLTFEVRPRGIPAQAPLAVWVEGRRVSFSRLAGGGVRFSAPGRAGAALDWAVERLPRVGD